ncbi:MAG: 2-hydroxyacyl-CoA dehydratase family protein [Dehalococcoidia bacterium]|nr:2-hydroxyacyl-CoA dehydratase family protein [Dehalococcoidia bacterium]
MEDRLRGLIEGNAEANRTKWALEWKKQGKKVIGTICLSVPEEIIYAAGMLPWRVSGTWRENTPLASAYRLPYTCPFCTHVLESLLTGELGFMDGVVFTDRDYDIVRLSDVWTEVGKTPFLHIMHLPQRDSELARLHLAKGIRALMGAIEKLGGKRITDESLSHAIDVYNERQALVANLFEMRKREKPPLSGAEVLGITTAAGVMPADEFNRELKALLPYIERRKPLLCNVRPRLLVSSDMLDNPAYLRVIEDAGCLVAMDDLDTGSRHFQQAVDTGHSDPAYALAKHYITGHGSARTGQWDEQAQQVVQWVKDFSIDGVVDLRQAWCFPRMWRAPFFQPKLAEAGIPNISIEREYHLANVGQLRTRIEAFLEMLGNTAGD